MHHGVVQESLSGIRVTPEELAHCGEGERLAAQLGPKAIVQVAAQTAALLLARRHEAFPRPLELGGQLHRMGRNTGLAGQVVEQSAVGRRQRLILPAGCQHETANDLLLIDQWEGEWTIHWSSGGCHGHRLSVALEGDGRVRELQSLADRLHHGWEHRFGRESCFKASPQLGNDGVGIVALAVHHPIDAALQPLAQRLEEYGN
jgi:hypothetical protein